MSRDVNSMVKSNFQMWLRILITTHLIYDVRLDDFLLKTIVSTLFVVTGNGAVAEAHPWWATAVWNRWPVLKAKKHGMLRCTDQSQKGGEGTQAWCIKGEAYKGLYWKTIKCWCLDLSLVSVVPPLSSYFFKESHKDCWKSEDLIEW